MLLPWWWQTRTIDAGGGGMGRNIRWALAGLVTAAAFTVPAWLCGSVVLPPLLKDPAIRWSLASALGAVLGSLAVLWGHGFATRPPAPGAAGPSVRATAERAVAIGGDNRGAVSTGDGTTPAPPAAGPRADPPPAPAPDSASASASASAVSASGSRAIAIGGTNTGPLSTGDQPTGGAPDGAHP